MHLGKVLIATSAALYLQKGDAAGLRSGKGHGELFAAAAASLKSGGVKACGAVVNSTLREVARTYTEEYVSDVLSHVCHDGTFFHEFPTKEVCLALSEKLVAQFDGKQDYPAWCKEFEEATRAAESNSTANGTNATAVQPPEPVPLMNASNATPMNASNASNATRALVSGASDAQPAPRVAGAKAPKNSTNAPAPKNSTKAPAPKSSTNATSGASSSPVKAVAKKDSTHKSKKKKTHHSPKKAFEKAEEALKTALKAVKAASEAAPAKTASKAKAHPAPSKHAH